MLILKTVGFFLSVVNPTHTTEQLSRKMLLFVRQINSVHWTVTLRCHSYYKLNKLNHLNAHRLINLNVLNAIGVISLCAVAKNFEFVIKYTIVSTLNEDFKYLPN